MAVTEKFWPSLTCLPKPGSTVRTALEELLYAAGCTGIWDHLLDDCGSKAKARSVDINDNFMASGEALLTAYFPAETQPHLAELALQLEALGLVAAAPQLDLVQGEDWLHNWRQNFTITELTDNTLVVPTWEELPAAETRLGLRIYPGQGFGTGTHETTRLAAAFLEQELGRTLKPVTLLDVGTGSGILAILAIKRGAERVLALDIDADALVNARENCSHNLVSEKIILADTQVTQIVEKYSLIVANIIAPVLRQLVPELSRLLTPGGRLILSGILVEQLSELTDVYAELGLVTQESKVSGEWTACVCKFG
ncbi:MAG TPA: 50S ribosomal protein L11 methyltransferase [Desulfarculaceae bacterium]|nr:50S ribosomal protein L11 methyltransferase [Desulfarculaceae bacterium]